MANLSLKGHDIQFRPITNSHVRRAQQFANSIVDVLRKIGVGVDDVEVEVERMPIKSAPASASWYYDGRHLFYSYSKEKRFVDNLQIVWKVIDATTNSYLQGKITEDEYILLFEEDKEVLEQRKSARTTLGLAEDETDLDVINNAYKKLAKQTHPDTDQGDHKKFQEINKAHKLLKKELS